MLVGTAFALAVGGGHRVVGAAADEIVITCQTCEASAQDVFATSRHSVVEAFNERYAGQYRIEVEHYGGTGGDDLQYWERLALADALPDIFVAQGTILQQLAATGKLVDFAPLLDADPEWSDSFYPGSFDALTGPNGEVWGIPEQRDVVGIWYNQRLFEEAGISNFPTTWDEFRDACERLKESGVIPFAMDGDWVTQLMWANLVGTGPDGAEFLRSGIREGGYSANPAVVQATEFLKALHTDGYVNEDAFSGDFASAGNAFLQEDAAMIANGPWFVIDLNGEAASADVNANTAYEVAPGWEAGERGALVLAGNAGWASGTLDPERQEAVAAFMQFTIEPDIQFQRTLETNAFGPVAVEFTEEQEAQLEPRALSVIQQAGDADYTYPHAKFATPQPFTLAWLNDWPAYVNGDLTTEEFLDRLAEAVEAAG